MNWLDIVLLGILAISTISGFARGLVKESIGLAATIVGIILAARNYSVPAEFLRRWISDPQMANIAGFFTILVGVMIAGGVVASLVSKVIHTAGAGWLDRLSGGGFGALRGLLLAIGLLMILMAYPIKEFSTAVVASRVAPYISEASYVLSSITPPELKEAFSRNYDDVRRAWMEVWQDKAKKLPEMVI